MRESLKDSGVNVWNDCSTTSNNWGHTVVRGMARSDEIVELSNEILACQPKLETSGELHLALRATVDNLREESSEGW